MNSIEFYKFFMLTKMCNLNGYIDFYTIGNADKLFCIFRIVIQFPLEETDKLLGQIIYIIFE